MSTYAEKIDMNEQQHDTPRTDPRAILASAMTRIVAAVGFSDEDSTQLGIALAEIREALDGISDETLRADANARAEAQQRIKWIEVSAAAQLFLDVVEADSRVKRGDYYHQRKALRKALK